MTALSLVAFIITLGLGVRLIRAVLAQGAVSECGDFFRADALSAWMVLLVSIVSLATSLYAGRYFQRELAAGEVTPGRVREFFVLTPLFGAGMFLVVATAKPGETLGQLLARLEALGEHR